MGLRDALELKNYEFNAHGVEMGQRYASTAIVPDGSPEPPYERDPELYYQATTWPGARLPHLWLDDGNPLHDVLGSGFTLLRIQAAGDQGGSGAPGAPTDRAAVGFARELAAEFGRLGAPLDLVEVTSAAAQAVYPGHRLILVRPDLHVAWRSGYSMPSAAALAALVTGNQVTGNT